MNEFPKNDSKIGEAAKGLATDLIQRNSQLTPAAAMALTDAAHKLGSGNVLSDPDQGQTELPPITEADNPRLRFSPGNLAIFCVVGRPR